MKASTVLAFLAALSIAGGVIGAFLMSSEPAAAVAVFFGGVVSGVLFYALSEILDDLRRIAANTKRSADALERRVQPPTPEPASQRRSVPTSQREPR